MILLKSLNNLFLSQRYCHFKWSFKDYWILSEISLFSFSKKFFNTSRFSIWIPSCLQKTPWVFISFIEREIVRRRQSFEWVASGPWPITSRPTDSCYFVAALGGCTPSVSTFFFSSVSFNVTLEIFLFFLNPSCFPTFAYLPNFFLPSVRLVHWENEMFRKPRRWFHFLSTHIRRGQFVLWRKYNSSTFFWNDSMCYLNNKSKESILYKMG